MKLKVPKVVPKESGKNPSLRRVVRKMRTGYKTKLRYGDFYGQPGPYQGAPMRPGQYPLPPYDITDQMVQDWEKMKKQAEEDAQKTKTKDGAFKIGTEPEIGLIMPASEMAGISKIPLKIEAEEEKKKNLQEVNIYYSLIPRFPKKGEVVYAYTHIKWNPKLSELVYYLVEPSMTENDMEIIDMTRRELEEKLDVDFSKLGPTKAEAMLGDEIMKILNPLGLTEEKRRTLSYYIKKEIIGLGRIEALMLDPNIEDISCDGVGIPVYIYHRDPQIGSLKANVVFRTKEELDTFTIKLAQKCHKTITIAEPLLDASLPDGSRVQATLGTDIARKGSNFTIRKFTQDPLTPTHMVRYGTMDSMQLAYLWLAIENKQSILISGGTATGKTSMLNALSLFIKPSLKVVSIEDTAELRLPHPHWIPEVARSALEVKGRVGEVTLFDLLKSSLRQRPDYIIVGEVRGKEAFVLFQQIATGHAGLSTIHAASLPQLSDRLTTPPISLPPTLLENINIIVFLVSSRLKGNYIRRADKIIEVVGLTDDNNIDSRELFVWSPATDAFDIKSTSFVLKKIGERLGITDDAIKDEVIRRKKILEWMVTEEIFDYREVGKIVATYYSNPERILDLAMADL